MAQVAVLVLLAGCATIVNGTTEKVTINSTPEGADVLIDGFQHFTTLATIDLSHGDPHTLVFDKAGYQEVHEALTSSGTGLVWGNILLGGVVGAIVDESNGASSKLSRDSVEVTLVPISQVATSPASSKQAQGAGLQPASTESGPRQGETAGGAATPTAVWQSTGTSAAKQPQTTNATSKP